MAHTNRGRVILGGLLAGVVINLVEFVTNGLVLKDSWAQVMQAMGKPAQPSGSAILLFNVWGFLLGIAAVWYTRRYGRVTGQERVRPFGPDWRPGSSRYFWPT